MSLKETRRELVLAEAQPKLLSWSLGRPWSSTADSQDMEVSKFSGLAAQFPRGAFCAFGLFSFDVQLSADISYSC